MVRDELEDPASGNWVYQRALGNKRGWFWPQAHNDVVEALLAKAHSGTRITYIPGDKCVELKSLKLYVWSYRDQGAFHEAVSNKILNDLVNAISPRFMRITAKFNVRGGIYTNVIVEHRMQGWTPPAPVELP